MSTSYGAPIWHTEPYHKGRHDALHEMSNKLNLWAYETLAEENELPRWQIRKRRVLLDRARSLMDTRDVVDGLVHIAKKAMEG